MGSLAILTVHTVRMLVFAWHHNHFANDDLRTFWYGRTKPLASFFFSPIDDHFVPLHRLVCYLFDRVAPMNFTLALGLLGALHVATMLVLWSILQRLRPSRLNMALVCLYGLHASMGAQFLWWTAGLGRLGCIFFSVLATHFYLRYRTERGGRLLVLTAVCNAAALGFYAKGVLVPLFLVSAELALRFAPKRGERSPSPLALGVLAPVVAGYLALWWAQTPPGWHKTNVDPMFHAQFVGISIPIFAADCLGFWLDDRLGVVACVAGTWAAAMGYSIAKSRLAALAWLGLLVGLAVSMSMVGMSAVRAQFYGLSSARLDRYYFDAMYLVPLFVGIAFRSVEPGLREASLVGSAPRRWALAAAILVALSSVSAFSWASYERIQSRSADFQKASEEVVTLGRTEAGNYYVLHDAARSFTLRLAAGLERIPEAERRPLYLVDTELPWYVVPWGDVVQHSSELLVLMGEDVRVRSDGAFVVSPFGDVLDARRWRTGRAPPRR